MSSDATQAHQRAGRLLVVAVAAGLTFALMETAFILSQPGAAIASSLDLGYLVTWLAVPYAVLLGAIGLVGALALSRWVGFAPAFAGAAMAGAFGIWLRIFARAGERAGPYTVLILVLVLVACAAGTTIGVIARRGAAAGWMAGVLTGLAIMVEQSRNEPGAFGRTLPPPHLPVRLLGALALGAIVGYCIRWARRRWSPADAVAIRVRRLVLAACVIWLMMAGYGFSTLLSYTPSAPALGVDAGRPQAGAPNVILISVDTLRADHLSCYGYGKPTTPAIDRLAAEGVRFEQASSTASFTLPSHASMMTGLFPSSHGATYQNRDSRSFTVRGMGTGYPTLAEILREHGYDTAGFVSGPLLSRQFGFSRGFNLYDDRYDRLQSARARLFSRSLAFRALERVGVFSGRDVDSQRIASEVNPLVEGWLRARDSRDRPFFLFVHYWDPHGPYDPPSPWGVRPDGSPIVVSYDLDRLLTGEYTLTPSALADTLELYDGEVSFVDRSLGELFEMLKRDGTLDHSLVIFTADHGESFGEHAHWEHSRVLYEDVLRVPFIARLPGGRAAGTVLRDIIAQPTDILPMALSVAGLPVPEGVEGRDLTRWIDAVAAPQPAQAGVRAPGLAFAELDRNVDWPSRWGARFDHDLVSARTLRWKYIRSSTGKEELYDLERDAAEIHDLSAADPNTTATLRALTDVWRKTLRGPGGERGTGEIDEGLKDNLRSLGYVQ